jgi:hypothetical protein
MSVEISQLNAITKVEFHCHTSLSHDCEVDIADRLFFFEKHGFTHLAITDHDRVLPNAFLSSNFRKENKVLIIPGIEISTFAGHIILYNCNYKPLLNSLWFLVFWSYVFRCEISVPHPCRSGTGLFAVYSDRGFHEKYIYWFMKRVKYIEVFNSRDREDDFALISDKLFFQCKTKVLISGSDSHYQDDVNIDGCPLNGYSIKNKKAQDFFAHNLRIGHKKVKFNLTNIFVNLKWNIRYLLKGF